VDIVTVSSDISTDIGRSNYGIISSNNWPNCDCLEIPGNM